MNFRPAFVSGLLTAAWLALIASSAVAQTPAYIKARPDGAARAFGSEMARKIFSEAFTPVRRQAVLRSQQAIPGFDCPADPQIVLEQVIPYPLKPGVVSWIERYVIGCTPRTMRNFLLMLEGDRPQVAELLPGTTNTDPLLQRDAIKGAYTAIGPVAPKDCDRPIVTDTRLTTTLERNAPWNERWSFDLCGAKAEVEMTFTPSAGSGTTWGASLVK
jgi:hypothetical protein